MIDIFVEQKIVTACMFACLFLSIFLKIFLGMLYRHMIKEADNMAITNNKLLKQCKMKFTNCYELNNGIHNIPVFVDKFINRLSLGRLSFDLIYHISGQLMLFSVAAAGIGVSQGLLAGHTLGDILPYYAASFLGLYLFFSVSTVADIKGKRRVLKINLVDYLENHLSSRMSVTRRDLEMLYGEALFQEQMDNAAGTNGRDSILYEMSPSSGKSPRGKKGLRGEKRNRGEKGKRVVELMPMGGRLAAGKTAEDTSQEKTAEATGPGMTAPSLAAPSLALETADLATQGATPQGMTAEAELAAAGMTAPSLAAGYIPAGMTARQALGDAAVTEEELEMLLKEFLTG